MAFDFAAAVVVGVKLVLMAMSLVGAIASFVDAEKGIGKEWRTALEMLPDLFMAIGGILCAKPVLVWVIARVFGWFSALGSTPAVAGCMLLGIDMGGNQLAQALTGNVEDYYVACVVAYSLGVTVAFNIPVGLLVVPREDHSYLALGLVAGVLTAPIAAIVTYAVLAWQQPMVNAEIRVNATLSDELRLDFIASTMQLLPVPMLSVLLFVLTTTKMEALFCGLLGFGKALDLFIRMVFWASGAEMVTQLFTGLLGLPWPFDPLMGADGASLEIAGSIAVMLTGIYPLMFVLRTRCARQLRDLGRIAGLCEAGTCGAIACLCNSMAMFGIYSEMTRESKVVCAAIMVCGSFSLGDYLAYASVYQPGILPAVVLGKLVGAAVAIPLAWAIVVPIAKGLGGSDGDRLDAYRPMGQTSQNSSFLPTPKSGAFSPTSSRSCVRSLSVQRMLSQFADDTAGEARSPSACSPGGAI